MGIITRLESSGEERGVNMQNFDAMLLHEAGGRSNSGVAVTPENALTSSAVYACVRVLSETMASLPLMVYKRLPDGGKEPALDHHLYPILHDSPNTHQTSFEYREMGMGHLSLRGNAYSLKEVNGARRIVSLIPLSPANMKLERKNGDVIYIYTWGDGRIQSFPSNQIWHLKGLSDDGLVGLSPVTLAREAIGLSLATEEHGARLFSNGAQPGGTLEHPGKLTEDAAKRLKVSWQAAHSGGANAHKVAVLEEGLSWKAIGMSNEDSQFLQTRDFQVQDIARIFRVPGIMIGHPDKTSTFASAEQFFLSFAKFTVVPWARRIEQSANMHLLSKKDQKTHFVEFNLNGLLRGDTKARFESYAIGRQNEWLSANDVRKFENMNPIEGGDEYKNPAITVQEDTLDDIDDNQDEE